MLHTKQADREEIMSVAMAQPHRAGVSAFPDDAWMSTPLGWFCRSRWVDKGTQHERWQLGERYAQLWDSEKIYSGHKPRQCAPPGDINSPATLKEQIERKADAIAKRRAADEEMRCVHSSAPKAVFDLAWEGVYIPARWHGIAYNALYRLKIHFEAIDKAR